MPRLQPSPLHLTIDNDLSEIGRVAPLIDDFCAAHALGEGVAHALNLALDELLTNTISYGYDDAGRHAIDVVLTARGDRVFVEVSDDARAFDPLQAEEPDLDAGIDDRPIGGLGIHIVRAMMDEMRYERVGGRNRLTLMKRAGD